MKCVDWKSPNLKLEKINLSDNKVHLWRANLNVSASRIEQLNSTLSTDEKDRAKRFKFVQHQNCFIAARGFLRQIIHYYLQIPQQDILFQYSDRGKPKLAYNNLQFNLSHSQNIALYGITKKKLIGIDIEYVRSNVDCSKIAERFFNYEEYKLIKGLDKEKQAQTFFHLWTIKEAYLKATGEGLVGGLDAVEINLDKESNTNIVKIGKETTVNNWFFSSFIPQDDFIATVAVKNQQQPLTIKQFSLN